MDVGVLERWNLLVGRGEEVWGRRARLDAELLGAVYELWCDEALVFGVKDAELSVAREFRLALGLSAGEANVLVPLAVDLHERLPQILGCMRAGLVDQWRAEQARDVFATLTAADAAEADRRVAVRVREQALS